MIVKPFIYKMPPEECTTVLDDFDENTKKFFLTKVNFFNFIFIYFYFDLTGNELLYNLLFSFDSNSLFKFIELWTKIFW